MTYRFSEDDQQAAGAEQGGRIPIDKPCVRCGHNLRGERHDAPCSECGLPAARQDDGASGAGASELGSPVAVCSRCGYDLRATPPGRSCPECGLPVSEPTSAYDALDVMPLPIIRRLRLGAWVTSVAMIGAVNNLISAWRGVLDADSLMPLLLASSILWGLGVVLITPTINRPEGIVHGFHARGRLRRLSRWLQLGWIGACTLAMLDLTALKAPGLIVLARSAMWIALFGGLTGAVLLAIVLERLADWTRDDSAGRLLSSFQFLLPTVVILTPVSLFMPGALIQVLMRILVMAAIVGTVFCFVVGLLGLSKSITLSVLHAQEHQERQLRRHRRQIEHEDEMDQTVKKITNPQRAPRMDRRRS